MRHKRGAYLLVSACCFTSLILQGCSGALSRRQATKQISKELKPKAIDRLNDLGMEPIPGFELPEGDHISMESFKLANHTEYGPLASSKRTESPDSDTYLVNALAKLGYVTVEENGPTTVRFYSSSLSYSHSRTVRLTSKVGTEKNVGYAKEYSSGFSCYPPPDFRQCSLPKLIVVKGPFTITGITQDQNKAEVNILIDWEVTPFAKELQPYAEHLEKDEAALGDDSRYRSSPILYGWANFLNHHKGSGSSPSKVLFKKFDDGWRIVDAQGRSEEDFKKK